MYVLISATEKMRKEYSEWRKQKEQQQRSRSDHERQRDRQRRQEQKRQQEQQEQQNTPHEDQSLTPHAILGLEWNTSWVQVKRAYRKLELK